MVAVSTMAQAMLADRYADGKPVWTPLVATSLIRETGMNTAPAFVMVGCALLTLASAIGLARQGGYVLR